MLLPRTSKFAVSAASGLRLWPSGGLLPPACHIITDDGGNLFQTPWAGTLRFAALSLITLNGGVACRALSTFTIILLGTSVKENSVGIPQKLKVEPSQGPAIPLPGVCVLGVKAVIEEPPAPPCSRQRGPHRPRLGNSLHVHQWVSGHSSRGRYIQEMCI